MYIVSVFIFQRNGHVKSGAELGMRMRGAVTPDADRKGIGQALNIFIKRSVSKFSRCEADCELRTKSKVLSDNIIILFLGYKISSRC